MISPFLLHYSGQKINMREGILSVYRFHRRYTLAECTRIFVAVKGKISGETPPMVSDRQSRKRSPGSFLFRD